MYCKLGILDQDSMALALAWNRRLHGRDIYHRDEFSTDDSRLASLLMRISHDRILGSFYLVLITHLVYPFNELYDSDIYCIVPSSILL